MPMNENIRKPRVIVSSVGTSLLTNILESDERSLWAARINATANLREEDIDSETRAFLVILAERARKRLKEGDIRDRRRRSAELNGIYGIYHGKIPDEAKQDLHFLIQTDTYQGSLTATLLKDFLKDANLNAEVVIPQKLNTNSTGEFNKGIRELIERCHTRLTPLKESGYRIFFNLVGGFKALQGYMNTIGMFYADRIYYIFEGSDNMINIPKLPVRVDSSVLKPHAALLAMMSVGNPLCSAHQVKGILGAGVLFEVDSNGDAMISPSGMLIWEQVKEEIFLEGLLEFPGIEYSSEFRKDFNSAQKEEKIGLQEALAKVASLLAHSGGDIAVLKADNGLQLESYQDRRDEEGLPIMKFRYNKGMRVSCVKKGDNLLMRKFDHHDKVNDNP